MTQDKMRRIITACVSAATVLLVALLGYLIYQWTAIGIKNKKIETLQAEITQLEQQLDDAKSDEEYYLTDHYLQIKLEELELIKGK